MRVVCITLLIFAATLPRAFSQAHFVANPRPEHVVPPSASDAGAYSFWQLNQDFSLGYEVQTIGVLGTNARLMEGAEGENGSVLFDLSGGPKSWNGKTPPLTPDQVQSLIDDRLYLQIESTTYLNGEIRDQLQVGPVRFSGRGSGSEVIPPSGNGEGLVCSFEIRSDRSMTYFISTSLVSRNDLPVRLHAGGADTNGPVMLELGNLSGLALAGTTPPLDLDTLSAIQSYGSYVVLATETFPEGALRANIVTSSISYGYSTPGSVSTPTLFANGSPKAGGQWTLYLEGGTPRQAGFIAVSTQRGAAFMAPHPVLLGSLYTALPICPCAQGFWEATVFLPPIGASFDLNFQFWGMDAQAPRGLYVSNGVTFPFTVTP